MKQKTIHTAIQLSGIGVHSGKNVDITIEPTDMDTGICFHRTDLGITIPAIFDFVSDTMMSTTLTHNNASVSTVEHLMAAFLGCGITNAKVLISSQEMPIMDGSSLVFCEAIQKAGIQVQEKTIKPIIVEQDVVVEKGSSWVKFTPFHERVFSIQFDFYGKISTHLIPRTLYTFNLDHESFYEKIASARTFGLFEDGEKLKSMGLAKGASLENTVVIKNNEFLNKNGLRNQHELIQHKILDAIGDIALSPHPIIGKYEAYNPSHELNNRLLRKFFNPS